MTLRQKIRRFGERWKPVSTCWQLLAYVVVLSLVAYAIWRNNVNAREHCVIASHVIEYDIPKAFDRVTIIYGEELEASPDDIEYARRRVSLALDEIFPNAECT